MEVEEVGMRLARLELLGLQRRRLGTQVHKREHHKKAQ